MLNNAEQMEKDGFNGATITQLLMIILPKTSTLLYPTKVTQDFTDFLKDFKRSGLLKTDTARDHWIGALYVLQTYFRISL